MYKEYLDNHDMIEVRCKELTKRDAPCNHFLGYFNIDQPNMGVWYCRDCRTFISMKVNGCEEIVRETFKTKKSMQTFKTVVIAYE